MTEIKRRIKNIFISIDQTLYSFITLGNSGPDETMSSAAWRLEVEGRWQGKVFRPTIDFLFSWLEKNHCYNSYLSELNGTHNKFIRVKNE